MPGAALFGCGLLGHDFKEPDRSKNGNRNGGHNQENYQKPLSEKTDSRRASCSELGREHKKKVKKRESHETWKRNGAYN
jgi:hypothetical protein